MASITSTLSAPFATLSCTPKVQCTIRPTNFSAIGGTPVAGLRLVPKIQITKAAQRSTPIRSCVKKAISCSMAQPETLQTVQSTIAKQLSIDETAVTPQTKFSDLGADSLDIVEIMMALEEKFEVSIGKRVRRTSRQFKTRLI